MAVNKGGKNDIKNVHIKDPNLLSTSDLHDYKKNFILIDLHYF